MEQTTTTANEDSPAAKMCSKCNNFWGKRENNYLCSSCFKDSPEVQAQAEAAKTVEKGEETKTEEKAEEAPEKPVQVKKNRCWACNTKVGMLGFDCKCGYIYCSKHRHFDDHECSFQLDKTEQLTKANPLVLTKQISSTK